MKKYEAVLYTITIILMLIVTSTPSNAYTYKASKIINYQYENEVNFFHLTSLNDDIYINKIKGCKYNFKSNSISLICLKSLEYSLNDYITETNKYNNLVLKDFYWENSYIKSSTLPILKNNKTNITTYPIKNKIVFNSFVFNGTGGIENCWSGIECGNFVTINSTNNNNGLIVYPPNNTFRLDKSFIHWWKFNGNALDSKDSLNGTLHDVTIERGFFAQDYFYDGTDDYITFPDVFIPTGVLRPTNFTILGRAKLSSLFKETIISQGHINEEIGDFYFVILSNNFWLNFVDTAGSTSMFRCISSLNIPLNEWFFFGVNWDGTNNECNFIVNDVLEKVSKTDYTDYIKITGNRIGQRFDGVWDFSGSIDELMIFNRSLSFNEMKNINNNSIAISENITTNNLGGGTNNTIFITLSQQTANTNFNIYDNRTGNFNTLICSNCLNFTNYSFNTGSDINIEFTSSLTSETIMIKDITVLLIPISLNFINPINGSIVNGTININGTVIDTDTGLSGFSSVISLFYLNGSLKTIINNSENENKTQFVFNTSNVNDGNYFISWNITSGDNRTNGSIHYIIIDNIVPITTDLEIPLIQTDFNFNGLNIVVLYILIITGLVAFILGIAYNSWIKTLFLSVIILLICIVMLNNQFYTILQNSETFFSEENCVLALTSNYCSTIRANSTTALTYTRAIINIPNNLIYIYLFMGVLLLAKVILIYKEAINGKNNKSII